MADASTTRRDRQLMAEMQAGSAEAFGELYDRHCGAAWRVAMSVRQDPDAAEEAVQSAFLAVWKSREAYRPDLGVPAAWIVTIARHRAIDGARARGREALHRAESHALDRQPADDNVAEGVVARAEARRVQLLLDILPDAQREVIDLAFYGGLSHAEIALRLGLPPGTVKGRMRLGLARLRGHVDRPAA